jgi:hypothetical protein
MNANMFLSILLLIFITLKLLGVITWSWLWVLSPFLIPAAVCAVLGVLSLIVMAVIYICEEFF